MLVRAPPSRQQQARAEGSKQRSNKGGRQQLAFSSVRKQKYNN
jgi:hypothetical protein